jgi:hypothetical protein
MASPIIQRVEQVQRTLAGEAGLSKDDFTYLYQGQLRRVFNRADLLHVAESAYQAHD